jgi:hypothetical protein
MIQDIINLKLCKCFIWNKWLQMKKFQWQQKSEEIERYIDQIKVHIRKEKLTLLHLFMCFVETYCRRLNEFYKESFISNGFDLRKYRRYLYWRIILKENSTRYFPISWNSIQNRFIMHMFRYKILLNILENKYFEHFFY